MAVLCDTGSFTPRRFPKILGRMNEEHWAGLSSQAILMCLVMNLVSGSFLAPSTSLSRHFLRLLPSFLPPPPLLLSFLFPKSSFFLPSSIPFSLFLPSVPPSSFSFLPPSLSFYLPPFLLFLLPFFFFTFLPSSFLPLFSLPSISSFLSY